MAEDLRVIIGFVYSAAGEDFRAACAARLRVEMRGREDRDWEGAKCFFL